MGLGCLLFGHDWYLARKIPPHKKGYATRYFFRCKKCQETYTDKVWED